MPSNYSSKCALRGEAHIANRAAYGSGHRAGEANAAIGGSRHYRTRDHARHDDLVLRRLRLIAKRRHRKRQWTPTSMAAPPPRYRPHIRPGHPGDRPHDKPHAPQMPRVQNAIPSLACRAWKGRPNPLLLKLVALRSGIQPLFTRTQPPTSPSAHRHRAGSADRGAPSRWRPTAGRRRTSGPAQSRCDGRERSRRGRGHRR